MRENINTVRVSNGTGKSIFISYSSKDKAIVDRDCDVLRKCNVDLWIDDKLVPGIDWRHALKKISSNECAGVIFYISENSITSKSVQKELRTAAKRFGKPISIDKDCTEKVEGFFSVNIGGKSPAQIKAAMRASKRKGRVCREFLKYFNNNVIYIPRNDAAEDISHMTRLLDVLKMYDVITPGVYDSFQYKLSPEGAVITGYIGTSPDVIVPDNIIGYDVVSIGQNAFNLDKNNEITENNNVETLYIPDSVKTIGNGAFRKMTKLREIRLPKELHRLGEACFRENPLLKTVELPRGLKVLEQAMFKESGIESIVIPDDVEELGEAIFAECRNLETAVIPDSVKKMTGGGFLNCSKLRNLTIPKDIVGLDDRSFSTCPYVDVIIGDLHYHDGIAEKITDTD